MQRQRAWAIGLRRMIDRCLRPGGVRRRRARTRRAKPVPVAAVERLEDRLLLTITIVFDYSRDANGFFSDQARRDLLETAGVMLGNRLQDQLLEIDQSRFPGAVSWAATFTNPSTGASDSVPGLVVPEDTLIVYVGARQLGSTLAIGGPGGWTATGNQAWFDRVDARGQSGELQMPPSDFGPWGGQLSFDIDANWYFGATTNGLDPGETDFLSVAVHELGHLLGVGTAGSWDRWVSGGFFTGPNSVAEYDGVGNVPLSPDLAHWANGTTDGGQEAAMDPSLTSGTRKLFTDLDWAALKDIGWEVSDNTTYTITLANGSSHTVVIRDDSVPGNGISEVVIDGGMPTSFAVPTTTLIVQGGDMADTIKVLSLDASFGGVLQIEGNGGDDAVDTSALDVTASLSGGSGRDTLASGAADDTLIGNAGDDVLRGGAGSDRLFGGAGDDVLTGDVGADTLNGQGGGDALIETLGGNVVLTDTQLKAADIDIVVSVESATIAGDAGAQTLDARGFSGPVALDGKGGDDTLRGGDAADTLVGGDGADRLVGNGGDDSVDGGAGNDSLFGGAGDDTLGGGTGADQFNGQGGSDLVVLGGDADFVITSGSAVGVDSETLQWVERVMVTAGSGDNTLDAASFPGEVTLIGGGGDDTLNGGPGADQLVGNSGNDSLVGSGGADRLFGGAGTDTMTAGDGDDTVNGQGGTDEIRESADADFSLSDNALSGRGNDVLSGIERAMIEGGASANQISAVGFSGDVTVLGGNGDDTLTGGSGDDRIDGGDGADSLVGEAGRDTLIGGGGDDVLKGRDGADELYGESGNDTMNGGAGDDRLFGGLGDDGASGWTGHDLLAGNAGDDTLVGGMGNDSLYGGARNDIALGEDGDDLVNGQGGVRDTLAGGPGNDTLVADPGEIDEAFSFTAPWVGDV
ncbi:MAG: hypothetical protein D6725_05225 [Planctomycetota bacterium]|nr:MAG: hypothetical protein D6725_05225 [Planctomycetota bacterium]